jgi:glycosyltransferase involved in cell wall biosynthesis
MFTKHSYRLTLPMTEAKTTSVARTNTATTSLHEPVRVLFFDHTAVWSGGEIALFGLIRHLDQQRYHPVVALCAEGPLADRLREIGIETHILPLAESVTHTRKDDLGTSSLTRVKDVARVLRYVHRLAAFIRTNRIAIVHTNSLKADILGGMAARLARVPVIWHVRDLITSDYLPRRVADAFRRLCHVLPTHVITNSHATSRTIALKKSACPRRQPHISVVHDGTVRPAHRENQDARRDRQPRIGLVGRISPWKGQHIFLQAAAAVRDRFPEARFQIIGSALFNEHTYEQELHQLTATLNLEESIEFTGFRADVADCIANLDILVHASTSGEPFGQVVIEGMVAGKPVVATRGGGVPEIVQDGYSGLLVPMSDAPAMAEAICRLLGDSEFAAQLGQQGQQHVHTHFLIDHTARKVEAVYEQVMQGRPRRTFSRVGSSITENVSSERVPIASGETR